MARYGYNYQVYSTYSTIEPSPDEAFGYLMRGPFVPNTWEDSYDYVPKKTPIPIATKPYEDDYNYRHGSPTKPHYLATHDDEWHHPQKSEEFFPKRTTIPVATRPHADEYKHGSPTKPYSVRDGDEWHPPTSPIQRPDDQYLPRRTTVPIATRPYGHDYEHASPRKAYVAKNDDVLQHRKSSPTERDDEFYTKRTTLPPIATRPYGGNESKHSSPKPEAYPTRYDDKWQSPPARSIPVIATDWRRSPRTTGQNGNYGEDHRPIDASVATGYDDKYGDRYQYQPNRNSKPVISQGWSSSPRNGTQLSEATNDIDKITEMLRKAGRVSPTSHSQADYGTHKATAVNVFRNENDDAPPRNGLDVPIDGRRRFANLNLAGLGPGPTIDSREAEKKYKGRRI